LIATRPRVRVAHDVADDGRNVQIRKITTGGRISLPAEVRRRWRTQSVSVQDLGDRLVVRPLPDDPIAAARGALKGRLVSSTELRRRARKDEAAAEARSCRDGLTKP
jgi:bifunctional DNA-binding transcriptional regulator/antitoxin component of YhaV-PrlF toxin-antitoxin module